MARTNRLSSPGLPYGPIPLGKIGKRMNYAAWHQRCELVLGRKVKFGEILTETELFKLGFLAAATGNPSIYRSRLY